MAKVNVEDLKLRFSKTSDVIIKVAAVVGALSVIAGGYAFYINWVWQPKVTIVSVDFTQGIATITATMPFGNAKTINIYGGASYYINGNWAVQFGSTLVNSQAIYNSIELTRNDMVVEYLNA